MSENDWWNDRPSTADPMAGQGGGATPQTSENMPGGGQQTLASAPRRWESSAPRIPTAAHTWGSGHAPDQFLLDNPPHNPNLPGSTPEEAAELRRHQERLGTAAPAAIPPKPTEAPTVGTPADETSLTPDTPNKKSEKAPDAEESKDKKGDEEKEDEELTKLKALLTSFREKREQVSEKTEPARTSAKAALETAVTAHSGPWSYVWSLSGAWVLSPTFPVALIDRVAMVFGSPRPLSGTERMDWGFLHGPGVWFGEQLDQYGADGNMGRLILLSAVGAVPVAFAQFGTKIAKAGLRKALGWISYGLPVFFICMPYYFDSLGFHTANDLYITTLAASAWWGFFFSRTLPPGLYKVLLRIPLAAVIVGLGHYAPGAAF